MLTARSYTRVTLALDIVRWIEDGPYKGYHELGTIKHKIDLSDTISVEEAAEDVIECNDPLVPLDGRNICLAVATRLRKKFGIDHCVRITIEKKIPVMGGLAGGSANAATTLGLLNRLWGLDLSAAECIDLGRLIGMDVPYYFVGGTAFDAEAGLRLEPIESACSFSFVLACPEFGVSTSAAYAGLDYSPIGHAVKETALMRAALEKGDAGAVVSLMHNDFESSVYARYPRLAAIKREMLDAGCLAAMLTGSGSTVIGIARDRVHAEAVSTRISCRTILAETLPGADPAIDAFPSSPTA
jgi:4-diphosphocytidyl-2-C-methyl-D-erythritol kinase